MNEEQTQSVFEEPLSEDSQSTKDQIGTVHAYAKFTPAASDEEQTTRKKVVPLSSKLPLPLYILVRSILLSPLAIVGALLIFLGAFLYLFQ